MVEFANKDRTKVRTGIVLDSYIIDKLDSIVISSRDLGCTRSEVINAVLNAFFTAMLNILSKPEVSLLETEKDCI